MEAGVSLKHWHHNLPPPYAFQIIEEQSISEGTNFCVSVPLKSNFQWTFELMVMHIFLSVMLLSLFEPGWIHPRGTWFSETVTESRSMCYHISFPFSLIIIAILNAQGGATLELTSFYKVCWSCVYTALHFTKTFTFISFFTHACQVEFVGQLLTYH